MRKNKKIIRVAALSMCLSISSMGVAFADTTEKQTFNISSTINEDLLQKQKDVDQYLFVDHAKEIEELGFMVTYTGQVDDYVEVGIAPYNETNANYIYEIFGNENVKVVKGEQATLAVTSQLAPDELMTTQAEQQIANEKITEKQVEIDKYLFGDYKDDISKKGFTVSTTTVTPDGFVQIGITPFSQENADYLYELFGKDMVKVVEEAQATTLDDSKAAETAEVVSVADDAKEEKTNKTTSIIIGIVAAVVLSFIAIFTQKKKPARR